MISDEVLARAQNFYSTSPDGQYDLEVVEMLEELKEARKQLKCNGYFYEALTAKDKWINELLRKVGALEGRPLEELL